MTAVWPRVSVEVDPIAVLRLVSGDPPRIITTAERMYAAHEMTRLGLSASVCAERMRCSARTIQRYRARARLMPEVIAEMAAARRQEEALWIRAQLRRAFRIANERGRRFHGADDAEMGVLLSTVSAVARAIMGATTKNEPRHLSGASTPSDGALTPDRRG